MNYHFILLMFFWYLLQVDVSGSFLIYNTLFPMYKKIRKQIQKQITEQYINEPKQKLIISTPAGLHGFYLMGVTRFIKENYNLSDFIFSGASAGSWNSLFLCFQGNDSDFIENILNSEIYNATSINQIEKTMKKIILEKYNQSQDLFLFDKVSIGVTTYRFPLNFRLKIYQNFSTLEDTLDCCVASSHIPFITGNILHKYKKEFSFDGGFFSYPYLNTTTPVLRISPSMWDSKYTKINSYQNPLKFSKNNMNFSSLYLEGYKDSQKNKHHLDRMLRIKDK